MLKKKLVNAILIFLLLNLIFTIMINILGIKIVTLSLKSDVPAEIQIFYLPDKNDEFNEVNSKKIQYIPKTEFSTIRCLISTKHIDKFRIDFGILPADFKVNYLSISDGFFFKKVWSNKEQLKKDFNYNHEIEIYQTNNDYFEFKTIGNDGFISGNKLDGETKIMPKVILLELMMFLVILIFIYNKILKKSLFSVRNTDFVNKLKTLFKKSNNINLEIKNIKSFLIKNKYIIYIMLFFTILSHGVAIFYYKIGIDSEKAIQRGTNTRAFTEQGRYGISALKKIFSTDNIVIPAYNILLGLSALILFAVLSTYIMDKYSSEKSKLANISFMIMFITFSQIPTYTTFIMYSFEVSMGYFIVALSMLFITKAIFDESSILSFILGIMLLSFAISIYQCFIALYAEFVCIILLIKNQNDYNKTENKQFTQLLKYILVLVIACIIYFIFNLILTHSLINSEGYLGSFLGWKNYKFSEVISIILHSIKSIIFDVYGFEMLKVAYIGLFIVLAVILLRKKHISNVLYLVGFMLAPFLLNIILGSIQPIRSLVALPFFIGAVSYGFILIQHNKTIKSIIFIFILLCSMYQAQATSKLYFGDYVRYNQDVQLGDRISERIEELEIGEKPQYPVVYIGGHSSNDNALLIRNETIGYSFFEWDFGNISRIQSFMSIIGHNYIMPSQENIRNAYENSKNMPIWPNDESVKKVNDIIIVKLSEPSNYWEITNGLN